MELFLHLLLEYGLTSVSVEYQDVICVACAFGFIWNECLGCQNVSESYKILYFSSFAIVFQFGWASTQIGQLSLLPELTSEKKVQVELTSMRYGNKAGF